MAPGRSHTTRYYDVIFAGGGAAGLSLAYHLSRSAPDLSMLIVDEQVKDRNDHTWCYWTTGPSYLDPLAYRTWDQLALRTATEELHLSLAPYRYQMVRAIDFYRFMQAELGSNPQIQFLKGTVRDIGRPAHDAAAPTGSARQAPPRHHAEVVVNQIAYQCAWVFDSRYRADAYRPLTPRHHYLIQHFLGWEIETEKRVFDPTTPTLFDFRTPQHGAMRFLYLLPYAENRGLVEYTVFSKHLLPTETYRQGLHSFLKETLHLPTYRVLEEERDLIPMTDHPYPRRAGVNILNIGTRGGRVKPSSGYAFHRIQTDALAIAKSMAAHGHPFDLPQSPTRYRTFDAMLLQILDRHGELGAPIFMRLFRRNPVQRVFRFLDEEDGLAENLKLMATVPPWPFIRAWLHLKLRNHV